MRISVVEDAAGRAWIEESCPVGGHYWTIAQAAQLATGGRTGAAFAEAVALARDRRSLDRMQSLPAFDAEPQRARRSSRTPSRRAAQLAGSR